MNVNFSLLYVAPSGFELERKSRLAKTNCEFRDAIRFSIVKINEHSLPLSENSLFKMASTTWRQPRENQGKHC